ncbi:MAG: EamA family transporter [Bacteroidales bacterium]|nr:EamA family transporter [Bacteroidales bacterium]
MLSAIFAHLMNKGSKFLNWIILAILSIIWGTSFILIKKGLESFSSFQVGSLRILITFLFLLPVALRNIKKINRENLRSLLIIGFIGSGFPAILYPLAQTHLDSSVAGMLNSLTPVFTLLLGVSFYSRKVNKRQVAGLVLGFIGAAGLIYNGSFSFNAYGLLIVLATSFYGISSNQVALVKGMNGLTITSLAFLFIGPLAGISLIFTDFNAAMETENFLRNLAFVGILAVFGTGIALAIFNVLILRTSPIFGSSVTYLIPIVAVLWGISDEESIKSFMIISVICILAGVYLINIKATPKKDRRE